MINTNKSGFYTQTIYSDKLHTKLITLKGYILKTNQHVSS